MIAHTKKINIHIHIHTHIHTLGAGKAMGRLLRLQILQTSTFRNGILPITINH